MPLRKVILAPASFKETLSAQEVAAAMAQGVRRVSDQIIAHACPVADGGEGTMNALVAAAGGRVHSMNVAGPLNDPVVARIGVTNRGQTAIVEMAEASGLTLVPPQQRDPMRTTSFGTGQLMHAAATTYACREIIVCIGGSATVDGGTGIAQGFGFRFYDRDDSEIAEHLCGYLLQRIAGIGPPPHPLPRVRVACDVANPLCGPQGAAAVYGPQKGATPEQVRVLDAGLAHLAKIAGGDPDAPGAGAAGGAGYGLATFFNATLERGIDVVLNAIGFAELCRDADLVITGEGRLDAQSLNGKATIGVAKAAAKLGVPTIAIVGSTGPGVEDCVKPGLLESYHSLADRFGLSRALHDAKALIADLANEVVRNRHV